ncbi:MAG: AAA family ATPase, partial [Microcoleaceae cyanobacterium]
MEIINSNYQLNDQIYESDNSLVFRGTKKLDNQPIILKILKENYPTPSELTRYRQEYEITSYFSINSIIKAYELHRYENSLVIVLEDFGGESLKLLLDKRKLSLEEFITITIKITEGLVEIHKANIIHKDINPSNIVYNTQTEQLKIIDFGISTRLSQEFLTVIPFNQLEGTLAYIAPEQTGRMNRGIDYRSDFYSLGVTFYELLTNQLPFATTDVMELVHCHIAQQPLPVHELTSDIPLTISNIISKLLAKTSEERYQSAWGIKADLETCLHQLKTLGKISQFPLASQDISDKFHIPQKLYGREQEINQLLNAFERISQGKTGMVLISGYSGIGKSALVKEIHKPITKQRGKFLSGKFDQLQRDIPYSAITQAFRLLVRKLLSEPELTLQTWKKKILGALGNNGQIIIDVIPEVEKIIGEQPAVEQLGRTESQNRFNLFFQRFLSIFCKKEHPLVIFIDDLQWADLPSLHLIEQLISNDNNQYFLMIGAYRDNEVSPAHPLIKTLENINQAQVPINKITLYPLTINHINQLIADTLKCSTEVSKPLAELVAKKTGGNPFFLTQLLDSLYQENLLVFNPEQSSLKVKDNQQCYWQWDIEQIEIISITDNVVDLMIGKIEKLDEKTQQVLKLAACIGNNFNLEILSIINNKSKIVTAKELQISLNEGLIIPLDNNYKVPLLWNSEELLNNSSDISSNYYTDIPYKFLHDRVQQAAYSLIPEVEKKQVHLQVGRLLLKNIKEDELKNKIFDIVNQLNEGSALISKQLEKNELAKLNLQAGKKAKASTAYESASIYFKKGINLLPLNSWKNHYNLTINLYLENLESLYLNATVDEIEPLSEIIINFSQTTDHTIKVYQIKSLFYMMQLKSDKAIESTRKALAKLDIYFPIDAYEIEEGINQKQHKINLFLKQNRDLAVLPAMTQNDKLLVISILQNILTPTLTTNFSLFVWVILTQFCLCLEHGNPPQAPSIYSYYGRILCSGSKDIDLGYKFGNLSKQLMKNDKMSKFEPLVHHVYCGSIGHWKESLKELDSEENLPKGIDEAINIGDNHTASYAAITFCFIKLFGGYNLEEVFLVYEKYLKLINQTRQEYASFFIQICRSIPRNLLEKNYTTLGLVIGDSPEEEHKYLKRWLDITNEWLLFVFYLAKTITSYVLKNYVRACDFGFKAEQYVKSLGAYLPIVQHNFYSSLSFIAYYNNANIKQKKDLLEQVENNQKNLKIWAGHCRENFQHKYDLVEAEKARILGQTLQAQELYDRAIQGAKKYEFIHEEALAYERAAEFYLALDRIEIGQLYLRNAHHCYIRWGAKAKVKQLEEEYPEYLLGVANKSKSKGISTTISSFGNDGEILDLTTVIKASQAISGEIKLENLLNNLMKITIENAGAQTGFLILNHQGNWVIEAQGKIDSDQVTILQSIPIESTDPQTSIPILPTTVINYVIRSQENIVLNDAANQGQFINDPYIIATQSKSILCTPLINQGQLSGIVYLENNLTTDTFTSKRVELLNILS